MDRVQLDNRPSFTWKNTRSHQREERGDLTQRIVTGGTVPLAAPQHTLCAEFSCSRSTLHVSGLLELGREALTEEPIGQLSSKPPWEQSQVPSKRFTWKESPLPGWMDLARWDIVLRLPSEEETLDLHGSNHFCCLWMTSVNSLCVTQSTAYD